MTNLIINWQPVSILLLIKRYGLSFSLSLPLCLTL